MLCVDHLAPRYSRTRRTPWARGRCSACPRCVPSPNCAEDSIDGGGANDLICSLDGADLVDGGLGNDRIDGGPGDDTLTGDGHVGLVLGDTPTADLAGGGNDLVLGGTGNDRLTGDNFLLALFSPELTFGASGGRNDTLDGGPGVDNLLGDNRVDGDATGDGNDTLIGGADNDGPVVGDNFSWFGTVTGAGNDIIRLGDGNDFVVGDNYTHGGAVDPNSAGNDDIAGDAGNDTIVGDSFDTAASGGTRRWSAGGTTCATVAPVPMARTSARPPPPCRRSRARSAATSTAHYVRRGLRWLYPPQWTYPRTKLLCPWSGDSISQARSNGTDIGAIRCGRALTLRPGTVRRPVFRNPQQRPAEERPNRSRSVDSRIPLQHVGTAPTNDRR